MQHIRTSVYSKTSGISQIDWVRNVPPNTLLVISGTGFYGSNDPTNSVKALKEQTDRDISEETAVVSINEVNLRRARLVLGWVTVSGFNSRCRIFISVRNLQTLRPTQPSIAPGSVDEDQRRLGRQKADMVHSDRGWTRGVQIKLWHPLTTCAIFNRLRWGVFTTRRYTNPRLPLPYLTLVIM